MKAEVFTDELGKSRLDKVCMFAFQELSNFVDWFSESEDVNEHYQNQLYLLMTKMSEMVGGKK